MSILETVDTLETITRLLEAGMAARALECTKQALTEAVDEQQIYIARLEAEERANQAWAQHLRELEPAECPW